MLCCRIPEAEMRRIVISIQEPTVRNPVRSILKRTGAVVHEIAPCVKPDSAGDCELECYPDQGSPDVMIFDVLVERACSGVEAAQKALQRFPGLKILLISATPPEIWPVSVRSLFGNLPTDSCAFLPKPFTANQLNVAVDALFNRQSISRRVR